MNSKCLLFLFSLTYDIHPAGKSLSWRSQSESYERRKKTPRSSIPDGFFSLKWLQKSFSRDPCNY